MWGKVKGFEIEIFCRFCVQPNDGFEQQLREFEPIYRARVEMGGKEGERGGGKREREEGTDSDGEMEGGEWGVKCRVQDTKDGSVMEVLSGGGLVMKIHSVLVFIMLIRWLS